jgi:predicted ATPase
MASRKRQDNRRTYRFTGLLLENWRNFVSADVELQRRTFLVGPNASGKSNLLDAFRFLYDIATVGGGFQEAVRKRGGVSGMRALAARRYPDIGVRVVVGDDESEGRWEYHLRFAQDNIRRPFIKEETVLHNGEVLFQRPNAEDEADPQRKSQTYLEQVNVNREFRELVDFLGSVRYRHIVPQLVRDPDRSIGRENDPFGGDFLDQLARTQTRTLRSRLRRITKALQVAVPQLQDLELQRDERGTPHLRGRYEHWRSQGAWQSERELSDGTLRLLGFLWSVIEGDGPLLLEEPELSLHPEVVRHLPQLIARAQRGSGRQIIMSTHSADLLQDTGIGMDEVLLLIPANEGTKVHTAGWDLQIRRLLEAGLSMADAAIPYTRPENSEQLTMFADL